MLGLSNPQTVVETWNFLESQAVLSEEPTDFFAKHGAKREFDSREHQRFYFRCKGIIRHEGKQHGVYLKDCSRSGMAYLSPIQFFPRQRIQLWTENKRSYQLEITRCRRLQERCYECGAIYIIS